MPRPLFELRHFVFVLQYKFILAFNSDMNDKWGLQSISIALFCFLERFVEAQNNNEHLYIVQLPIYTRLLTITSWHDKAATKTLVKSICLGLQHRQLLTMV